MDKPFNQTELKNGIVVEFFDLSNRYFGDFHRVKINALVTVPLDVNALPADLQKFVASRHNCVTYEKSLEQMGVETSQVQAVTESLMNNFIESVGCYLEKKDFAEKLLRNKMAVKAGPAYYRP